MSAGALADAIVVAHALFVGLPTAVREMKALMREARQ